MSEWVNRHLFNKDFSLSFGRYIVHTQLPLPTDTHAWTHTAHLNLHVWCMDSYILTHTYTHTLTQPHNTCSFTLSYSHLFNTGLKQITCKTCDTFKVQVAAERDKARLGQLHGGWELHLCKAERSYQQLKKDSALGKSDPNVLVISHNLYQLQSWPLMSSSSCGPT